MCGLALSGAEPARSATLIVTSLADTTSSGTFRWSISAADLRPGSTIVFQRGLSGTIKLTSGLPQITQSVTVNGTSTITVDGAGQYQAFNISSGSIAISGLTIQNCNTYGLGSAVYNNGGHLSLTDCTLTGDFEFSGGGAYGGALYNNNGTTSLSNCTFSEDICEGGSAGAISQDSGGTLHLTDCTFSDNKCYSYGGGAMYIDGGTLTATDCSFYGNVKDQAGNNFGGGALRLTDQASVSLLNCTFTGNYAAEGAAIYADSQVQCEMQNCILYGDDGGETYETSSSISAKNCDISGGVGGDTGILDDGGNIDDNPLFAPAGVAFNGGLTETVALLTGSPCFGAGEASGAPAADERGITEPNPPTIGAYDSARSRFDFNGDGKDDLLWENSTSNLIEVWDMNGLTPQSFGAAISTVGPAWKAMGVADVNADTHPDILWWNSSTGQMLFWEMTGATGTTVLSLGTVFGTAPAAWEPVSVADFNGDGHSDILFQNVDTGQLVIWYMNGEQVISSSGIFQTLPANWRVAGTADFLGSGHPDILCENNLTGQVLVWYMGGSDGTAVERAGSVFATVPKAWQIVSTGDTNGDGHPDLTWHNSKTGQTLVWLMGGPDGTAVETAGSAISPTLPTTWDVVGVR